MKRTEPLFTPEQGPSQIRAAVVAAGPTCFEDLHPSDQGSLGLGKLRLVGVYDDRYEGTFMLRIRIPGGWLTNEQTDAIADLTRDFAVRPDDVTDPDRFVEITTRQDIQVHWIRFEHLAEIWDRLEAVGIRTYQACGNSTRNVTSCAVNGVNPDEVMDVAPIVEAVNDLTRTDEQVSAFLPRKFKVAITGCRTDCLITRINCLAFTPAQRNGELGFHVHVGGGLSDYPRLATELDLFARPDLVPAVVLAVLNLFREEGDFEHASVNRFRALVHQLGVDRVASEIRERVPGIEPGGESLSNWEQESHLGVNPDNNGTNYVGLCVPVGRLTADELTEVARLARVHGDGGVRLTQRQDLILTGVADVDTLLEEPLVARLSPTADPFEKAVVACTSAPHCKFAILPMKKYGVELIEYLRARVPESGWGRLEGLRIHMSGCKASCAQVPYGHIGLRGAMGKDEEATFDAFDVAMAGDAAAGQLGVWVRNEIPTSDAFETVGSLLAAVAGGELALDDLGPSEYGRHEVSTRDAVGRK